MRLLISLFIAVVGAIDVLVIGISYGVRQLKIDFFTSLIISLIAGLGTYFSMLLGGGLRLFLPPAFWGFFSAGLMLLLGFYMLIDSFITRRRTFFRQLQRDPSALDINKSGKIEFFEIVILGFVLSINNIGLGISASLAMLNIYFVSIFSILFSMLFVSFGCFLGDRLKKKTAFSYTQELCAFSIIAFSVYMFFVR